MEWSVNHLKVRNMFSFDVSGSIADIENRWCMHWTIECTIVHEMQHTFTTKKCILQYSHELIECESDFKINVTITNKPVFHIKTLAKPFADYFI